MPRQPTTEPSGASPQPLAQQALNLLRLYLSQPGWARTTKDIYLGGRLLAETLPEPEMDWAKPEAAIAAMSVEERKAYRVLDHQWCATPVAITLNDAERELCRKCLEKLAETGHIGTGRYVYQLFDYFGFKPE